MKNESNIASPDELSSFVNSVVSMKQSLHTRKWASIYKRSTVSNASTTCSMSRNDENYHKEDYSESPTSPVVSNDIVKEQVNELLVLLTQYDLY
jgi:hypothetical protein